MVSILCDLIQRSTTNHFDQSCISLNRNAAGNPNSETKNAIQKKQSVWLSTENVGQFVFRYKIRNWFSWQWVYGMLISRTVYSIYYHAMQLNVRCFFLSKMAFDLGVTAQRKNQFLSLYYLVDSCFNPYSKNISLIRRRPAIWSERTGQGNPQRSAGCVPKCVRRVSQHKLRLKLTQATIMRGSCASTITS